MKLKKSKKILLGSVILLAIGGYIYYNTTAQTKEDLPIITATATMGTVETCVLSTGTLNPASQFEVKSLVKGTILNAPFEEGDMIKKGDVLYEITTNDISNSIQSQEIALEKAKLSYEDNVDRKKDLIITTQHSGYIKKLYVKEGDRIQAGTAIADVYNGDVLYLDLLFPALEINNSFVGKSATVLMDATQATIKGKVTQVSDMTETMAGGILARRVTIRITATTGISPTATATATIGEVTSNNCSTFRAETETTITATCEGNIENLSIKAGDYIKAGTRIVTLSSKELDRQIRDANIAVEEAELSLNSQKNQLDLYTLTSPISGTIITKNKKKEDTIDPATDLPFGPMAIIYDMSSLSLLLNIDELQIHSLKKGQKVTILSDAFKDQTFEGVVERISMKGTTNNGITTYPVTVKVASYGNLLPGMNVDTTIVIERVEQVLTIPSSALQRGNIVYVKDDTPAPKGSSPNPLIPEGCKEVTVEIGLNDGNNIEIKSGLKEGDLVYLPFDPNVESTFDFVY